ncbi:MAG TPA: 1-acyl-sn-glycerol-3-phosphate acyltransferase [Chloroflexia bacterium]|nr:1-acyl-sn-glycerol-3-phosphate acyltransferase [Chloroflexia bacterium]
MPRKLPAHPHLRAYYSKPPIGRWLYFWFGFLLETLTKRRLARLVKLRLGKTPLSPPQGLEKLPATGTFVLAANHFSGWPVIDVIPAILTAANRQRPDLADDYLIIVGRREPRRSNPPLPARLSRKVINFAFARWSKNVIRLPLDNRQVSIKFLREWRTRVQKQPVLVFPEGKARLEFGPVRAGVGRWFSNLDVPVVPVGIWWHENTWHVRIGPAIEWSSRNELHDFQLGLAIANLLPPELATRWQKALNEWRATHQ